MLSTLPKMKELRFEITSSTPMLIHMNNNTVVWTGATERNLKESYRDFKYRFQNNFPMSDYLKIGLKHLYNFEHVEGMQYRNF